MNDANAVPFTAKEAFCLMWYACDCGHRERIWNSRVGVTPFSLGCPSCAQPTLNHVDWHLDRYAPDHKPKRGQRIWADMTRESALAHAQRKVASISDEQIRRFQKTRDQMIASIAEDNYSRFGVGTSPDLRIVGYEVTAS